MTLSTEPQDPADQIEYYLSGKMSLEERRQFEDMLLHNDALADEVYADMGVREFLARAHALEAADPVPGAGDQHASASQPEEHASASQPHQHAPRRPPVVELSARHRRARWQRWAVAALPLAAVLAVVWWMPNWSRGPEPTALRGVERAPELVVPRGDVGGVPSEFRWTADAGASSYRLDLYDMSMRPVYQTTTTDTMVIVPPAILEPFNELMWMVVPLDGARQEREGSLPSRVRWGGGGS